MFDFFLEPFQYDFMRFAFLIGIVISIPTALLSCFLVLKGWALMGDAISHAVLPGIIVSHALGAPLSIGAFIAGMLCVLSTGIIKNYTTLREDTAMGIVFSGMFGLGIVLTVAIAPSAHLDHILFGDLLGLSFQDFLEIGILSLAIVLIIFLKWRDLMLLVFDPIHASVLGHNIYLRQYSLLALLSLSIVTSLQAVGLVLSITILITPGAIAYLLTKRFSLMLFTSVLVSVFSTFLGIWGSFFLNSAPAPTIALIMTFIFLGVLQQTRSRTTFLFSLLSKRKP